MIAGVLSRASRALLAFVLALPLCVHALGLSFRDDGTIDVRVVAVVGRKPITTLDLDQAALASGEPIPEDSSQMWQFYGRLLSDLIDEELIYQAALAESIDVDAQALREEFDARWDSIVARFGGEEALRETLRAEGLKLPEFRHKLREQVRIGLVKQLYIQRHVGFVEVSDEEVRRYYEQNKDSLGDYPEQVELYGILFDAPPESVLWGVALARAESIYSILVRCAEFEALAESLSDDELSRADGGRLGEFHISDLPESFAQAISRLGEGEFTKPVRGSKGYHIIKLLGRSGSQVEISHIFVRLPSPSDVARRRAYAVYDSLVAGADFAAMARRYSADTASAKSGGYLGTFPKALLPPALVAFVDSIGAGAITPPVEHEDGWALYYIAGIIPPEPITPQSHPELLRELARRDKFAKRLSRLVETLREEIYVEVYDPRLAPYAGF